MATETRARIQQAARDIGFRPNVMARALVRRRSFTLGLLTNDTYGRFTLPVAAGLASAMADHGVSVFLCAVEDDPERVRLTIEAMEDKQVDGMVIAGKRIDRSPPISHLPRHMPVVYANAASPPDAVSFLPDDEGGAALATGHLLACGRRRIAHVTGPEDSRPSPYGSRAGSGHWLRQGSRPGGNRSAGLVRRVRLRDRAQARRALSAQNRARCRLLRQ